MEYKEGVTMLTKEQIVIRLSNCSNEHHYEILNQPHSSEGQFDLLIYVLREMGYMMGECTC